MINTKYNNLSCGYTGNIIDKSTLNSKFFGMLFNKLSNSKESLNELIIFPQRIPKIGFFEELYILETEAYKMNFDLRMSQIIRNHDFALENYNNTKSDKNFRNYLNWLNILIRYGKFDYVICSKSENNPLEYQLEINLLKETAKIELCLSEGKIFSLNTLLELAKSFIGCSSSKYCGKIRLLIQIIVYFHRHLKDPIKNNEIFNWAKFLLSLLKNYEANNFYNLFLHSIAYRGVAMVPEFGMKMRKIFLNKAYDLALQIRGETDIEKTVALENLYTCKLSIAKWHSINNQRLAAETHLTELTLIDPYDSTAFSELGFFNIQIENYEKASKCFYSALLNGPPGVGMNTYYYAKCLEKSGDIESAIKYLHIATEADVEAISPWLDLIFLYKKNNNINKYQKVAKYINDNKILLDQLEKHEISYIKDIIN